MIQSVEQVADKKEKIALAIKNVLNRFPNVFDDRLEQGFKRLEAMAPNGFMVHRSLAHLRKLLVIQFFLQKKIESILHKEGSQYHHLYLRFFRQESHLCLIFVLALRREEESISKGILLKSIQALYPSMDEVPRSFIKWFHPEIPYVCGYIELRKWRGKGLSQLQTRRLSMGVKEQLLCSLPVYTPAVFWPYNAEESYRQILILQQEIERKSDLPHVAIQFKGQLESSLEFLIHLATPVSSFSLNSAVNILPSSIRLSYYLSDFENYSPIKAHIFSMHIHGDQFYENGVLNLMRARRVVVKHLERIIGGFRDYNGGLLEKQHQQFEEIKLKYSNQISLFSRFAEPLFYSLRPIEKQISISMEDIESLFAFFSKAFRHKGSVKIIEPSKNILIMKSLHSAEVSRIVEKVVHLSLVYGECVISGFYYLAIVTKPSDFSKVLDLLKLKKSNEKKILRLNFYDGSPVSLNPHYIYREIRCRMIGKLLYEGLTRIGLNGKPMLTGAQNCLQENSCQYLFKIRYHFWSNR
ncbi:MAG: hypothetical protein WAM28_05955, partial [Chlamydiales bacterium]